MTRYDVQAPVEGYNGETGGVRFYKGRAHVDSSTHFAAVEYMRRRGYTLTEVREEETPSEDSTPDKPKQADSKAVWVKYVVATTDLTEAEAADLKKDELIELTENEEQA
ncbi:hypothetical protein [Nocardiopsis sp. CA-288880]|uniref:hypothetical protein n=1 Tax=Nocardiopsis sp. CA-288880 TaxID=3239995 RepID=UPI003D971362